jgi:hypothetical protein
MEKKERVIVIDLTGENEDFKKKEGKGSECTCEVCRCGKRRSGPVEGPRLELVTFAEPAPRRRTPGMRSPSVSFLPWSAKGGDRHQVD